MCKNIEYVEYILVKYPCNVYVKAIEDMLLFFIKITTFLSI